MKRFIFGLLGLLLAGSTGYAANENVSYVDIEAQNWWQQNGEEQVHIHTLAHFPLHQVVTGTFELPVIVTLHNNPGKVGFVRVQLFDKLTVTKNVSGLNWQCATDCTFNTTMLINTSSLADAKWEARITANIAAGDARFGKRLFTTSRYHVKTNNGNGGSNDKSQPVYRSPGVAAWYEGADYTNVYCGDGIVSGAQSGFNFLTTTQVGTVSTACKWDGPGRYMATLDPNFHAGYQGQVLLQGTGATAKKITFDASALSPGKHNLVVLSCKKISTGESCGVIKMPFTAA